MKLNLSGSVRFPTDILIIAILIESFGPESLKPCGMQLIAIGLLYVTFRDAFRPLHKPWLNILNYSVTSIAIVAWLVGIYLRLNN